ncbi:hypothetical protein TNCV_507951 [Trichonephila clavipes]|nr:hypothetical protein TNCV_507951 [Trichonephila clavipes]
MFALILVDLEEEFSPFVVVLSFPKGRKESCQNLRHVGLLDVRLSLTAMAGSDVVQSGRPILDDFFQHLWPYIGINTANVVFQMVKRLWLIRIDQ